MKKFIGICAGIIIAVVVVVMTAWGVLAIYYSGVDERQRRYSVLCFDVWS